MNKKEFFKFMGHSLMFSALFASCGSCNPDVIVNPIPLTHDVQSPGENLTSLTKVHETAYKCWTPNGGDGGRNLFFIVYDGTYSNIYRKETTTTASMIQVTGGHNRHKAPFYCPATNMIVFAGQPEGNPAADIYMVNAQGGAPTQITNTPDAEEGHPCLSRDGKMIVYEKRLRTADEKYTEIWLKNLQTNETKLLGHGRTPSFSWDGRSIVCVRYASDSNNTFLCVLNIEGGNPTHLTDAGMGTVWRPCFSPDGKHIVFQWYKNQKGDTDLYVVNREGNGLTQLTTNKSFDGEPYWANDGNIYFASDRGGVDGHFQIWSFRYGAAVSSYVPTNNVSTPTNTYTGTYHTVSAGETITDIARRYGVTVRDIVKWNQLTTMTITPGMKLKTSAQ